MSLLSLDDMDSVSELDRDTLAPLPPPQWNNQMYYINPPPYNNPVYPTAPPAPYSYTTNDTSSYIGGPASYMGGSNGPGSVQGAGNGSAGSVHSGSGGYHTSCDI